MNPSEIKKLVREEIRTTLSSELSGLIKTMVAREVEIATKKQDYQISNKKNIELAVANHIENKISPQLKNIVQYVDMKTFDDSAVTEYRKKVAFNDNPSHQQYFVSDNTARMQPMINNHAEDNWPKNIPKGPVLFFPRDER